LRTIQDWIIRRQLLGVKGVADVSSFGGKVKQYEVAINPSKLTAQNLSVADVLDAIEKNNQNTGGAYIEKGARVHFIRTEGLVGSLNDIENICIQRHCRCSFWKRKQIWGIGPERPRRSCRCNCDDA
jgi:cobalt-zinc-cadmium resistance protein CzcA